ncbi:MAG TPA: hypothetical protein O0X97_01675 [Methanocorpusculum sp.]|nr:hypothetical protein [Methanocorpusculum sp.]
MNEAKCTVLRNSVSGLAYLFLATLAALFIIADLSAVRLTLIPAVVLEVLIGICGIILLGLKKRDLTGIVMILFAMLFGYYTVTGGVLYSIATPVILVFFILIACILLLTKEKKAQSYFCVFLPYGIGAVTIACGASDSIFTIILHIIFGLVALIYSLLFLAPKANNKLALKLKSDEEFSFSESGPVIGYALLMIPGAIYAVSILTGFADVETLQTLLLLCGILLVIAGILLAVFSKQYRKSILFAVMGLFSAAAAFGGGVMYYITGGVLILLGILALFQKKAKILNFLILMPAGILAILLGFSINNLIINLILITIITLVSLYMTVVYFCRKKELPQF